MYNTYIYIYIYIAAILLKRRTLTILAAILLKRTFDIRAPTMCITININTYQSVVSLPPLLLIVLSIYGYYHVFKAKLRSEHPPPAIYDSCYCC